MSLKSTGNHEIISINIGKKKVALRFQDEVLNISPDTYIEFKLYKGKNLSDKEYKAILKKDKYIKDYVYALNLVANATYSVDTIRNKLLKRKLDKKSIEEIIKKLIDTGLLSDEDYIKMYLENANHKLFGKNKIKQELHLKGISEEDILKLDFPEKEELRKAKLLVTKLDTKNDKLSYGQRKKKIADKLSREGYDYNIIESVIDEIAPKNAKIEKEALKKDYLKIKDKYKAKYSGYELKDKIVSYLLRKGYSYNDIKSILEGEE